MNTYLDTLNRYSMEEKEKLDLIDFISKEVELIAENVSLGGCPYESLEKLFSLMDRVEELR